MPTTFMLASQFSDESRRHLLPALTRDNQSAPKGCERLRFEAATVTLGGMPADPHDFGKSAVAIFV